jgi:hypothetical protein
LERYYEVHPEIKKKRKAEDLMYAAFQENFGAKENQLLKEIYSQVNDVTHYLMVVGGILL